MNARRCNDLGPIDFLIATHNFQFYGIRPCATRLGLRHGPRLFTRLLYRLEPDPGVPCAETEPPVESPEAYCFFDDSTLDKPHSRHLDLVTRHWSGKRREFVLVSNLITLLWTNGDRKIPVNYRLYSKADGRTRYDHFWEMLLMARGRGFSPKDALFDGWYASL